MPIVSTRPHHLPLLFHNAHHSNFLAHTQPCQRSTRRYSVSQVAQCPQPNPWLQPKEVRRSSLRLAKLGIYPRHQRLEGIAETVEADRSLRPPLCLRHSRILAPTPPRRPASSSVDQRRRAGPSGGRRKDSLRPLSHAQASQGPCLPRATFTLDLQFTPSSASWLWVWTHMPRRDG